MNNNETNPTALVPTDKCETSVVPSAPLDPAAILQAVVAGGVTEANVAVVEKVIALAERMEDKKAERRFAEAFNALQAEMPRIQAQRPVPDRTGVTKYTFAPYEDIMEQLSPWLNKHGFTVRFNQRYEVSPVLRLIAICVVQHIGGHKESTEFAVRIGSGPPGASETQSDGAAGTYAKRFALCNAFNIVIEKDSDARAEGGVITKEQAESLRDRVKATASREDFFLQFAGVLQPGHTPHKITIADYEKITESKYAVLDSSLRKKEKTT